MTNAVMLSTWKQNVHHVMSNIKDEDKTIHRHKNTKLLYSRPLASVRLLVSI